MDWSGKVREARNVMAHSCLIDLRIATRNLKQHPRESKKHLLAESVYQWLERNKEKRLLELLGAEE